jgi:hypothetical protein
MKSFLFAMATLVPMLGSIGQAKADYIPFSGSGDSGTISTTPSSSIIWTYPGNVVVADFWSIPGVGDRSVAWNGSSSESEFTITFEGLPSGISISPIFAPLFVDTTTGIPWNGTTSSSGDTVTFFAPSGNPLNVGDFFFVNVAFRGDAGPAVSFTGAFDPQLGPSVLSTPEPSSLALCGMAIAAFATRFGWRRRAQLLPA